MMRMLKEWKGAVHFVKPETLREHLNPLLEREPDARGTFRVGGPGEIGR